MFFLKRKRNHCKDKYNSRKLIKLLGFRPKDIELYILALTPKSSSVHTCIEGTGNNNERLEFLGDAVLDAAVSEILFKRFPSADEGFLTQMRTKIVNGKKLSELAKKIKLDELIIGLPKQNFSERIYEDAFEAMMGAIYLDKGFKYVKQFVLQKIMVEHIDLNKLRFTDSNYKSRIIEWSQKHKINIEFITESASENSKEFICKLSVNDKIIGTGKAFSKKDAEQLASQNALKEIKDGNFIL